MSWIPQLTALRNRLAALFPQEKDARRLVEEAQLSSLHIEFGGTTTNNWHSILNQAHLRNKVEAIVQAAVDSGGGDTELITAYETYMKAEGKEMKLVLTASQAPSPAATITPPTTVQPGPIKILFLAANPRDMDPLKLDEEVRLIDDALRRANYREHFELKSQWAVRSTDLQELLLRYRPQIVHFAGHGDELGQLLLMDANGHAKPVLPKALASLFAILKDNIHCVILNACYTDALAQGIAQSIDFVLGMSRSFSDAAAIEFAAGFYTGIGWGRTIQVAFEMGRNRIELAGINATEQPQLIALRSDPAKVVLSVTLPSSVSTTNEKPVNTNPPPRSSRSVELKRQRLQTDLSDFERLWLAVDRDLRANTDVVTRDRLQQRLTQLEEDIAKTETELEALK